MGGFGGVELWHGGLGGLFRGRWLARGETVEFRGIESGGRRFRVWDVGRLEKLLLHAGSWQCS